LINKGWFKSGQSNYPIDEGNKPISLIDLFFSDFIKDRLSNGLVVFEFGTGNSTLFFAERVTRVVAVEHNKEWYEKIKKQIPNNVILSHISLKEYPNSVRHFKNLDIIIVDGEKRIDCIYNSVDALSSSGVLILDDSERKEYKKGIDHLINAGFKALNFWGIAPGTFFNKCTTIFYRKDNCLDI